jgi:hypothetical protein
MAKQKLTYKEVLLIKYLLNNNWNCTQIQKLIGKVGVKAISKIKNNLRWAEVPTPNILYGNELYLRYIRKGTLELE